jgi:hypothetical protein
VSVSSPANGQVPTDVSVTLLANGQVPTDVSVSSLAHGQVPTDVSVTSLANGQVTADMSVTSLAHGQVPTDVSVTSLANGQVPTLVSSQLPIIVMDTVAKESKTVFSSRHDFMWRGKRQRSTHSYPLSGRGCGGTRGVLDVFEKRKISCPGQETNCVFTVIRLLA